MRKSIRKKPFSVAFGYLWCMRILGFLTLLFLPIALQAQRYGNEWIRYDQAYYKIRLNNPGITRLLANDFAERSSINPKNLQLFCNGKEVPIYVYGEQDNSFDEQDFIEFYAERTDGSLDSGLYALGQHQQLNPYQSLYPNDAVYFLTWGNTASTMHFSDSRSSTISGTPINNYISSSVYSFVDQYATGEVQFEYATLSEYDDAEGWISPTINWNADRVFDLSNEQFQSAVQLRIQLVGRSNALSSGTYNHHFRVEYSSDKSTYKTLLDTLYNGYETAEVLSSIPLDAFVNGSVRLRFRVINDVGAAADHQAIAWISWKALRSTNLSNIILPVKMDSLLSAGNTHLQFSNFSGTMPILYDFKHKKRIIGSVSSQTADLLIPNAGTGPYLFNDSANFQYPSIKPKKVKFSSLHSGTGAAFWIITAPALLSGANDYSAYRSLTYPTLLLQTDDLYDEFSYGQQHPLAIRRALDYGFSLTTPPKHLLLLGKGLEGRFARNLNFSTKDLVPAIGVPVSDHLFSAGLNGTEQEPAVATGRLAVRNNEEVLAYLNKLKAYESAPIALWRKNVLLLSGGRNKSENNSFSTYLRQQESLLKDTSLGAYTELYSKDVAAPVSTELKQLFIKKADEGMQLLSYFGHGSPIIMEFNLGHPSEYHNEGKYPLFLLNGCDGGNHALDTSTAEYFIRYPKAGFIGCIGTSDVGYTGNLAQFSRVFLEKSTGTLYGASIGQQIQETLKEYQGSSFLSKVHTQQYNYQGDPALHWYAPPKPDYFIPENGLKTVEKNISAYSDSFTLVIPVFNLGKAIKDTMAVQIKRTLPNGNKVDYGSFQTSPVFHSDTFYLKLPTAKAKGKNNIQVTLNANQNLDELSTLNNTAELEFDILSGSVNLLFPRKDASTDENPPALLVQAYDPLLLSGNFEMVLDTSILFNSSAYQSSGNQTASALFRWTPALPLIQGKTYFWRARLNNGPWEQSVFLVDSTKKGWAQAAKAQFKELDFHNIGIDSSSNRFIFSKNIQNITIRTKGDKNPNNERRELRINNLLPVYYNQSFQGLAVFALHPHTLERYSYPSSFNIPANTPDYPASKHPYSGAFYFNTTIAANRDSLVKHLNSIPSGYYVFLYNGMVPGWNLFSNADYLAIEQLGAKNVRNVKNQEPYILASQKGSANKAIELFGDTLSTIPLDQQTIFFDQQYQGYWKEGDWKTKQIGPAAHWGFLHTDWAKEVNDSIRVVVIGIDSSENEQVLIDPAMNGQDLSVIDAQIYPYLRLKAYVEDSIDRTCPQLKSWSIGYAPVSELSLTPGKNYSFHQAIVQEGDSVQLRAAISSLEANSDSAELLLTWVSEAGQVQGKDTLSFSDIPQDSLVNFTAALGSRGMSGKYVLKGKLRRPKQALQAYTLNDYFSIPFEVQKDTKPPLLKVWVDGRLLLNDEIVSPRPLIRIQTSDENNFLSLQDSSLLDVYLKKSTESSYQRISYSSGLLQQAAAKGTEAGWLYQPATKLEDGKYQLKVSAKDAAGNIAGKNAYEVGFEVVNSNSITHLYPYPNPFSSKMRFVFTLTGDQVPDEFRIRILTVSGKIVREIGLAELGPIHIGNNISNWYWDGTDQYGDALGNGVYFYQVLARSAGKELEHRRTTSDSYFQDNWGKIYLMR